MNRIEVTTRLDVPAEDAFDALLDIEERSKHLAHFRGIEVVSRDEREMVVRMDEHVDGEDVTITSRFVFDPPNWLTYEHLEGPFGVNRGRFTLTPTPTGVEISQWHETEQDLDARPTLRDEWMAMMQDMHDTIGDLARRRRGEGGAPGLD